MNLDKKQIENKQRILIGGNQGISEIFEYLRKVLTSVDKPVDLIALGSDAVLTDAPVAIFADTSSSSDSRAVLQELEPHILLLHEFKEDKLSDAFKNMEELIAQFEELADHLPKAGTLLFNVNDDIATLIGKKEREDVKNIEYSSINPEDLPGADADTLLQAGAAKALLKRIGLSEDQFSKGIN